jgi:hypothetical protein
LQAPEITCGAVMLLLGSTSEMEVQVGLGGLPVDGSGLIASAGVHPGFTPSPE